MDVDACTKVKQLCGGHLLLPGSSFSQGGLQNDSAQKKRKTRRAWTEKDEDGIEEAELDDEPFTARGY